MTIKITIAKGGPGSGHRGHKGRIGKRGGSVPGTGGMSLGKMTASVDMVEIFEMVPTNISDVLVYTDANGDIRYGLLESDEANGVLSEGLVAEGYSDNYAWRHATGSTRSWAKAEIIADLAQRTGLTEECVNDMVATWAHTSNDNDMRSLSLQEAVSEEFGIELSDWQKENLSRVQGRRDSIRIHYELEKRLADFNTSLTAQTLAGTITEQDAMAALTDMEHAINTEWIESSGVATPFSLYTSVMNDDGSMGKYPSHLAPITTREGERAYFRAMYDATQERLDAHGYGPDDTVRLFRGISYDELIVDQETYDIGEVINYVGNAAESWSSSWEEAEAFSRRDYAGFVIMADVPRRNILSTARTGIGCLTEAEYVVLGNSTPGNKAIVVETYR